MVKLQYCLIDPEHRIEILVSLSHFRKGTVIALFATQKQVIFFTNIFDNTKNQTIIPKTFQQYLKSGNQSNNSSQIIIMDIPYNFQLLNEILSKNQQTKTILIGKTQKKYVNMIGKKIQQVTLQKMQYSHNKFININQKMKELVQKSYDINRQGFYAYGSYLTYFQKNLLKTIFQTQNLDVHKIALGFGFTVAPRVKEGQFLKAEARKVQRVAKRMQKLKIKKQLQKQALNGQKEDEVIKITNIKQKSKTKKTKKIKKIVAK